MNIGSASPVRVTANPILFQEAPVYSVDRGFPLVVGIFAGKTDTIAWDERYRNGRLIGWVMDEEGHWINLVMALTGYAWWFERYAPEEDQLRQIYGRFYGGACQPFRMRFSDPTPESLIGGVPIEAHEGWFQSDWLGNYSTTFAPWIYHSEHGFLYRHPESSNESMFVFYDAMDAWCWTSEEVYPILYAFDPNEDDEGTDIETAWIEYIAKNSKGQCCFHVIKSSEELFFSP